MIWYDRKNNGFKSDLEMIVDYITTLPFQANLDVILQSYGINNNFETALTLSAY